MKQLKMKLGCTVQCNFQYFHTYFSGFRGFKPHLFLFVLLGSCRKELLVQSPDNLKNALSTAEAKSYFNSHVTVSKKTGAGLSVLSGQPTLQSLLANKQPIWDKAIKK